MNEMQEMSQVTDSQVKKKKRDSLMLFRPLVRCVGRSVVPVKGESACAVTVSKKRCACFLGEGRREGGRERGAEKFKNEGRNEPTEERRT